MAKFGDYEETAKEYNIGGGSLFWKPEPGDNRIRILSEFEAYGSHFIKAENKSYTCIGSEENCPYCEDDKQNQTDKTLRVQFLMWILDRKDGAIKLAQVGYTVIKAVGELAKSVDWGFDSIPSYDIVIKRTGEKLKTEYFVTPTPNKAPLTAEEQALLVEKTNKLSIPQLIVSMKNKTREAHNLPIVQSNGMPTINVDSDMPPVPEEDEIKVENIPF